MLMMRTSFVTLLLNILSDISRKGEHSMPMLTMINHDTTRELAIIYDTGKVSDMSIHIKKKDFYEYPFIVPHLAENVANAETDIDALRALLDFYLYKASLNLDLKVVLKRNKNWLD